VQEESRGVGGCGTEICTNLRLLVMSGDKLHRQKESGWRMGAKMVRWKGEGRGRQGKGVRTETRYYKYRGYSVFNVCAVAKGNPLCRVSRRFFTDTVYLPGKCPLSDWSLERAVNINTLTQILGSGLPTFCRNPHADGN